MVTLFRSDIAAKKGVLFKEKKNQKTKNKNFEL